MSRWASIAPKTTSLLQAVDYTQAALRSTACAHSTSSPAPSAQTQPAAEAGQRTFPDNRQSPTPGRLAGATAGVEACSPQPLAVRPPGSRRRLRPREARNCGTCPPVPADILSDVLATAAGCHGSERGWPCPATIVNQ